jgi:hypothetical protein
MVVIRRKLHMIKIDQKTYEDIRNKVGSEKMEQVERQSGICAELHQSAVEVASPPDTYRNQRNSVPEIKPEESDCVFEHEPVKMPSANELIKSLNDDKSRSSETGTCSNALTIPDPIPSVSVSQDDDLIIGKPDVVRANTQQIIELHNAILGCLRIGLEKAIAIGDLLFEQKKLIKFGKFTGWCRRNLPFCPRTAQRYMKLSMWKEQLSKPIGLWKANLSPMKSSMPMKAPIHARNGQSRVLTLRLTVFHYRRSGQREYRRKWRLPDTAWTI